MPYQPIKFYQTGSFAVGNRLLDPEQRSVQSVRHVDHYPPAVAGLAPDEVGAARAPSVTATAAAPAKLTSSPLIAFVPSADTCLFRHSVITRCGSRDEGPEPVVQ